MATAQSVVVNDIARTSAHTLGGRNHTPSSECLICFDTVDDSSRVQCPECSITSCKQCVREHILLSPSLPACVSCNARLSYVFIHTRVDKDLLLSEEYVAKRTREILRAQEQELPAARVELDTTVIPTESRACRVEISRKLRNVTWQLNRILAIVGSAAQTSFADPDNNELTPYCTNLTAIKAVVDRVKHNFNPENGMIERSAATAALDVAQAFPCASPQCQGVVYTTRTVCSVCSTDHCSVCRVPTSGESHTCDEATMATLQMLKEDTKPCPKCKVPIHKIEGCDQMFCVRCKHAFSWVTLKELKGTIHNPHYFEYLAEVGQNVDNAANDQDRYTANNNRLVEIVDYARGQIGVDVFDDDDTSEHDVDEAALPAFFRKNRLPPDARQMLEQLSEVSEIDVARYADIGIFKVCYQNLLSFVGTIEGELLPLFNTDLLRPVNRRNQFLLVQGRLSSDAFVKAYVANERKAESFELITSELHSFLTVYRTELNEFIEKWLPHYRQRNTRATRYFWTGPWLKCVNHYMDNVSRMLARVVELNSRLTCISEATGTNVIQLVRNNRNEREGRDPFFMISGYQDVTN